MMSELGTTGIFPHRPRRPLRSQGYSTFVRVLSCCDALQASVHSRAQGDEEVFLEQDSALIKESLVVDDAKGTDASKDVTFLDNGGIPNLGKEELMVLDGETHVESRSTSSPGREHDGGSGNVVCEPVDVSTSMEVIAEAVRSVGIDNDDSAVNFFDGVEQELEELIFSPQNIDLPIADEGAEEGEISGDEGAFDLLFEDSMSLEEKKSDDLVLVSEDNVENGNDGDGQEGKFKIKSSPLLDKIEGGNDVRNLERSSREEPNIGAKSFRDNASSNYKDLDGGWFAEKVSGAEESHDSVISADNLAQRRQVTYEDIIDKKGSATAPLEVGNEKKRKRGPLTEERKAKRKRKDRIKRAEKNRQAGVKRLKLEPVVKPKKVVYCRHYMMGRCHEGEKCKFSHDATPLTKSTPCSFLARHSCMKGDDCPFDHELSKYPCNNFVSKGFCSRGADCLFKHEVSNINDPLLVSKLSNPELKSQLPTGGSNSKNQVNNDGVANQVNNDGVANRHSHTKLSPLNPSTGKLSENPIPRGINFISQVRSPITNAKKPEEVPAPELQLNGCVKSSSSTVSSQLDNKSDETAKKEPLRLPKGINFLSFGKSPLGISANKEKLPAESVRQPSSGSDAASSVLAHSQEKQNAGNTISTPNCSSALGSHTLNPILNQGGSSPWKTPVISNTPTPVQRALQSTLAFAAKIDSGIRLNIPTVNPFDVSSSASTSTFKG